MLPLARILHEGLDAFNAVLDKYTLVDLMLGPKDFLEKPRSDVANQPFYLALLEQPVQSGME